MVFLSCNGPLSSQLLEFVTLEVTTPGSYSRAVLLLPTSHRISVVSPSELSYTVKYVVCADDASGQPKGPPMTELKWSIEQIPNSLPSGCTLSFNPEQCNSLQDSSILSIKSSAATPKSVITVRIRIDHPSFDNPRFLPIILDFNSEPAWKDVTPTTTCRSLTSVSFATDAIGVAVGDKGTVLRTTDAGQHWSAVNTSYALDFSSISFADEKIGYLCGGDTVILKTIDAGQTWSKVTTPFRSENIPLVYAPRGSSSVFAISTPNRFLYKSTNTGSSWNIVFQDAPYDASIAFSGDKGVLLGRAGNGSSTNVVLSSSDAGDTWNVSASTPIDASGITLDSSSGHFVCCGDAGRVYSFDPGSNKWTIESTEGMVVGDILRSVHFKAKHGIAVGPEKIVSRTTGSGWHAESVDTKTQLNSVVVLNDSNAVAVGASDVTAKIFKRK